MAGCLVETPGVEPGSGNGATLPSTRVVGLLGLDGSLEPADRQVPSSLVRLSATARGRPLRAVHPSRRPIASRVNVADGGRRGQLSRESVAVIGSCCLFPRVRG